jgi:Na+/H+-dicarboxylate symporter
MTEARQNRHRLDYLNFRSLRQWRGSLQGLVRGRLWLQVLVGMVLGLVTGIVIGPSVGWVAPPTASAVTAWLALPGHVFLALIQMIVIPLVFASIIRGLAATEDVSQLRSVGLRVVLFFVAATVVAIAIGLFLALLLKPGLLVDSQTVRASLGVAAATAGSQPPAIPGVGDLPQAVLMLLPVNPLSSMVKNEMLQVVIFAVMVGIALVAMAPAKARPLLDLLGSLQEVCMTVVSWAMVLAPIAVFGLLAQLSAKIGLDALAGMAAYVGTVLLGLLLMLIVFLVALYFGSGRKPLPFLGAAREVLLLAFSTSSSAAVMPLSIRTAQQLGVRPSISQFVIPLGATINMNGTALYQGVAAIFLAQVFGVDIGTGGLLLIIVTAVGASIGTPATPGVGIVVLAMVLTTVGVPPSGIALIIGVDRILDMSRTAINVCGDLVAAVIMEKWSGRVRTSLSEADRQGAAS